MFSLNFVSAQKMVTVMVDNGGQQISDKEEEEDGVVYVDDGTVIDYVSDDGYDYDKLYGLFAIPVIGLIISFLTYLLKKYECHTLLRILNFFQTIRRHTDDTESYGSRSTATPPVIFYARDFSGYNTSQTSSYNSTVHMDKEIQTSLPSIEINGSEDEKFSNSDTVSKQESVLPEEDIIYINIPDLSSDCDISTTRSGIKYK